MLYITPTKFYPEAGWRLSQTISEFLLDLSFWKPREMQWPPGLIEGSFKFFLIFFKMLLVGKAYESTLFPVFLTPQNHSKKGIDIYKTRADIRILQTILKFIYFFKMLLVGKQAYEFALVSCIFVTSTNPFKEGHSLVGPNF